MKDGVKGEEGVEEIETWEPSEIAAGDRLVLFMRRSAVDKDCGFLKDKIVTTDTQSQAEIEPPLRA